MKNDKYFIGFDIGTDSVGYAVTSENYELCKCKGEPMWGVTLFDEAQTAAGRRSVRTARRRLDRKQQRVQLVMELFAEEINKVDAGFYKRIKESYLYPATEAEKVRIFDSYEKQRAYTEKYPTIHHLIAELMDSNQAHDVRLVYLACAWLVAHRGHFLSEVDKRNVSAVTDFSKVYKDLVEVIQGDGGFALPWDSNVDIDAVAEVLKSKQNKTNKAKALAEVLFGKRKVPKEVNEQYAYNYDLVVKLLCGGKVGLKELFGKAAYADLEEKSVALNMDDEKLLTIMQSIGDDGAFLSVLKAIYDWSVLVDVLKGKQTISEAKVAVYQQHQDDLKLLKAVVRKYVPAKYSEIFRAENVKNNYVAYIGKNKTGNKVVKVKKTASKEDFCKYIQSVLKNISPKKADAKAYAQLISRLENQDFMPKQVDGDNRVIPYQLYWHELNQILENAKGYVPFLTEADQDGVTGAEKVLSVFEFRVPYYVGPLKENPTGDKRLNHWMIRKAEGKIYPWNFEEKVDLDESENAFIARMTNSCTYLPGEDVLPKNSLVYSAFEVLNEINNIRINSNPISVAAKQSIYNNVFMKPGKITPRRIKDYLVTNNYMQESDTLGGLDISVKSSLKSFLQFGKLVSGGLLTYADAEKIIHRATYSEEKSRFVNWLRGEYPKLPESEIRYISGLKFKEFGRLSRKFLCAIEGAVNPNTGEYMTILRTMWETNYNLMQLLTDNFEFKAKIEEAAKEYYAANPKSLSERLEDMYVSNAVKRPIIRTLELMKDIVKVQGCAPERIFVEMARGAAEEQKGKRTTTRLQQIRDLYEKVRDEETRVLVKELSKQLDGLGDMAHNKLQSDKLFLYFIQLGKCLYTGKTIDLESVIKGDGAFNIEHIYPRSFVKDDSIINNKILVDSKANGDKSDRYPIAAEIRSAMSGYWEKLNKAGLLSDEKIRRLTRNTNFTEEEKFEFINRQLVETRQSTKVVAALLKELYPETEIVYVKAGLVSEFREEFGLVKSRVVNDLHHAKDAYLNIVVGNVWHCQFSRKFWRADRSYNIKPGMVFTHPVECNGKRIWNGTEDKNRVIKIAGKNTAHMTMYSYCKHSGQNGGFFDQNPLKAAEGLIPLKKDRPTELYGGYDSATVAGFALAKYKTGKTDEVSLVPVKALDMEKFAADDRYALDYVTRELGEKARDIRILLNKRVLKIYTMLSLDGARYCIRGKGSATAIGIVNMMPFVTFPEKEQYIKKLERFLEKRKKNEKFLWDEAFDGISPSENIELYDHYLQKLSQWPFNTRPGNETLVGKLRKRADSFAKLDVFKQAYVLLQIQGILGRMKQADLKELQESASSGTTTMSLNLSNWKKNYKDIRIVDQSASGLFEKVSGNLLELL